MSRTDRTPVVTTKDLKAAMCCAGGDISVLDESILITDAVTSIDFIGTPVTVTNVDGAVTVTINAGLGGTDVVARDEGVLLTSATSTMDFVGAGVTATNIGGYVTVTIPGLTSENEGVALTTATTSVDYVGTGVNATNSGGDVTVTIPGLEILNEGVSLVANALSIDFVGAGINATNSGGNITVTVGGGASDGNGIYSIANDNTDAAVEVVGIADTKDFSFLGDDYIGGGSRTTIGQFTTPHTWDYTTTGNLGFIIDDLTFGGVGMVNSFAEASLNWINITNGGQINLHRESTTSDEFILSEGSSFWDNESSHGLLSFTEYSSVSYPVSLSMEISPGVSPAYQLGKTTTDGLRLNTAGRGLEAYETANQHWRLNSTGSTITDNVKILLDASATANSMFLKLNPAGSNGNFLSLINSATGEVGWAAGGAGTVTGSGTATYIPRWSSTSALTNSSIYDDADATGDGITGVVIGGTAALAKLHLRVDSIGASHPVSSATDLNNSLGFLISNGTAATGGATVQVSPQFRMRGHAWDTTPGQNDVHEWRQYVLPASSGTTTSDWILEFGKVSGGTGTPATWTRALTIDNTDFLLNIGSSATKPYIGAANASGSTASGSGNNLIYRANDSTGGANGDKRFHSFTHINKTNNTGALSNINVLGSFVPSGSTPATTYTAVNIISTIDQSQAGSTGITRGVYVNPSLTSSVDFRAVETTNNAGWTFYGGGTAAAGFGGNMGVGTLSIPASTRMVVQGSGTGTDTSFLIRNSTPTSKFGIKDNGDFLVDMTVTAAGTTTSQTINKAAGSINMAAGVTSIAVTNSLVSDNSLVYCTVQSNDTTAKSAAAVVAAGSFTVYLNAAATAETKVAFFVVNDA